MKQKIKATFMLLCLLWPLMAVATTEPKLSLEPFSIKAGETKNLVVNLTNPDTKITLVEFYMTLPSGLSVKKNGYGTFNISKCDRVPNDLFVVASTMRTDGRIQIVLYRNEIVTIKGTEGAILSIPIVADNAFNGGTIIFSEILMVDDAATENQFKQSNLEYTVSPPAEHITITANNTSREYGDENLKFEYTVSGGTITGTPELTCTATKTSDVGEYTIIVSKGTVMGDVQLVNGTLTVTKAPLTVRANDCERYVGEDNPTFTLSYSGWKNVENESVLTKKPTATCSATKDSPAGTYPIKVSGGEAKNYELSYEDGTLTLKDSENEWHDGDVFTAMTIEGVEMTFKVINAEEKTCCVGADQDPGFFGETGNEYGTCIDVTTIGNVTIPSEVKGFKVTEIGYEAFYYCDAITAIIMPNTITTIGDGAFSGCSKLSSVKLSENLVDVYGGSFFPGAFSNCIGLTSIEIPRSLTYIAEDMFEGCTSLESVSLHEDLKEIRSRAFYGCKSLSNISLPNGLTLIGEKMSDAEYVLFLGHSFGGCESLKEITIPKTVAYMSPGTFSGCSSLTKMKVDSENPVYDSRGNCNAIIETATNSLFATCLSSQIPSSVKTIGTAAFCTDADAIVIPEGIENIDTLAVFITTANPVLKKIILPSTIRQISSGAFLYGNILEGTIKIDEVVSYIKEPLELVEAFGIGSFFEVFNSEIDEKKDLNDGSTIFADKLYVPKGTKEKYEKTTGWDVFGEIVEMGVPDSDAIFTEKNSGGVEITYKVISDAQGRKTCQVGTGELAIPINTKGILVIPEEANGYEVTGIGANAFSGCEKLVAVVLPKTITSVGSRAFEDCTGLQYLLMRGNSAIDDVGKNLLYNGGKPSNIPVYVRRPLLPSYKSNSEWSQYELTDYVPGDADNDQVIDVVDIQQVVNRILERNSDAYNEGGGDADEDNVVDVNDIQTIINMILGTYSGSNSQSRALRNNSVLELKSVSSRSLALQLCSDQPFSAFQFDLNLPKGTAIEGVCVGEDQNGMHIISFIKKTEGTYRIVGYSDTGDVFNPGKVVTINLTDIHGEILADNIVFSSVSAQKVHFDALTIGTNSIEASYTMNEVQISYNGKNTVAIEGVCDAVIRIYGIDGKEHVAQIDNTGDQTIISLARLPKGIYVIDANNKKFKIKKS